MTDHTMMPMPDDYCQWHGLKPGTYQACWTCGKLLPWGEKASRHGTCEEALAVHGWAWGPGQRDDPFASMRTNTAAIGSAPTWTPGGSGSLGSQGVTTGGMPIRREIITEGSTPKKIVGKPKEDVPGLTDGGIDKDAYDDFMRSL